jgi:hypothetical protein
LLPYAKTLNHTFFGGPRARRFPLAPLKRVEIALCNEVNLIAQKASCAVLLAEIGAPPPTS